MTAPASPSYAGHRFPAEVISHAVWLYFRFPLSLRMVEEMLAARGIDVSHETVRLEHLPGQSVPAILASLQAAMRPGALALHSIHLEDHRDFRRDPFAFLAADTDWRPSASDSRGNRLRASDWVRAFSQA